MSGPRNLLPRRAAICAAASIEYSRCATCDRLMGSVRSKFCSNNCRCRAYQRAKAGHPIADAKNPLLGRRADTADHLGIYDKRPNRRRTA